MVSKETAHGTSPLVRQRLDAFLKEYGDKGQTSPDHIRFLTYTTRYNRSYWVSLDGLEKHYERRKWTRNAPTAVQPATLRRRTLRTWFCARLNAPAKSKLTARR